MTEMVSKELAAAKCNVSASTIYNWWRHGKLPGTNDGSKLTVDLHKALEIAGSKRRGGQSWRWSSEEEGLALRYVTDRLTGKVSNYNTMHSDISRIAEQTGRGYFAVYRRIERYSKALGVKLPKPECMIKLPLSLKSGAYDRLTELARQRGTSPNALVAALIDAATAECSNGNEAAAG